MIDYYLFQTLFILLLSNSLCLEDLFLSKNCHKAILKRPHHKDSSWNKVIKVHENELRLCQKKCGKPEIQQTHCRQHEPEFVKDLGFQIKSDKCCDRKSCKCICSYFCRTLKSKGKELKELGYKSCTRGTFARVNQTSAKDCLHEKKKLKCESITNGLFICPKEHFCTIKPKDDCIQCIYPKCTTKNDLKLTKKIILELRENDLKSQVKPRQGGLRLRVDKSKRRHHGAFRQLMFNNHDDYSLKVSQGITL